MNEEQLNLIRQNIEKIKENIFHTAQQAGRNPELIELVAVTKGKTAEVVKAVAEFGVSRIGESFLKEALFKIELLADYPIQWHMIGPIQSGKGRNIAANFDVVHSVDKLTSAEGIHKFALGYERKIPVYLELNVSGEETKHGWDARNQDSWNLILPDIERILDLSALHVKGLMTMAPYSLNPEDARPYFKRLRQARDYLSERFPAGNIEGLSMGMSGDYEVAIEEGATILRIGSALVGYR